MTLLADLSEPQRDLLWTVAQHKYGWGHVSRHRGQLQVAKALVRRGLVRWSSIGEHHDRSVHPIVVATDAGKDEMARRWPVSPFVLGTYERQPGGWTSREGVR